MHRTILAATLLLGACAIEEAPEALGEPTIKLFTHFDDDEALVGEYLYNLEDFILTLDLQGDLNDRTFSPAVMTPDDVGTVPFPEGQDPEKQAAVAVAGISQHPVQAHLELATEPNQVCIESGSTVYYERTFTSDVDCFVDGTCDVLTSTNEVRKETISKVWYDLFKDFRRITLSDGREALLARSWQEEVFFADNGKDTMNQTFTVEVWLPSAEDENVTLRYYAMWLAADMLVSDPNIIGGLVKSGIDEGYAFSESFLSGEEGDCKNDRDREYDRPAPEEE